MMRLGTANPPRAIDLGRGAFYLVEVA